MSKHPSINTNLLPVVSFISSPGCLNNKSFQCNRGTTFILSSVISPITSDGTRTFFRLRGLLAGVKPGKSSLKPGNSSTSLEKRNYTHTISPSPRLHHWAFFFFFTRSVIHQISDGVSMRSVTANGHSPPQKLSEKIDIKEDKAKAKSSCDGAGAFTSSLKNTEIKVTFYILIKIKAKIHTIVSTQPSVAPVDRILGRFVFFLP